MSSNSSNPPFSLKEVTKAQLPPEKPKNPNSMKRRILFALGLPAWVFLGFMLAQALVIGIIAALQGLGVSFESVNIAIFNAVGGAVIYALSILLVIGIPRLIKKRPTTKEELGLQRAPKWLDLLLAPAGMIVYLILTTIVTVISTQLLTFVDYAEKQETGFAQIASQPEYLIAFISLVIVAPIAEEILFRGYLFGKLRKYVSLWVAILITSLLFAIVHFQWNVGIDVFVLSIVLCLLRVYSGSLWPAILLHMLKNGVAFYFLFINPSLL